MSSNLRFLRNVRAAYIEGVRLGLSLGAPHLPILDTPAGLEWLRGEVDFGLEDYKAAGLGGLTGDPHATPAQLYKALTGEGVRVQYGGREYVVGPMEVREATIADAHLPLAPDRWAEFVTVADPDTYDLTFVGTATRPGRRPADLTDYDRSSHGWRRKPDAKFSGVRSIALVRAAEAAARANLNRKGK